MKQELRFAPSEVPQIGDYRLMHLAGGVAGVIFEIIVGLLKLLTPTEYSHAAGHLCELVDKIYERPMSGSAMWVAYKRLFDKDLLAFIQGIDTPEKRANVRDWLAKNGPQHGLPAPVDVGRAEK